MDENKDIIKMLDIMTRPAFCVSDGMIRYCNQAARQLLIEPGTPIIQLIPQDTLEYEEFQDGCLYLTLDLEDQSIGASVRRVGDLNVFVTDCDDELIALQAMALAAMQIRKPMADIIAVLDQLPSEQSPRRTALDASMQRLEHRIYQIQRMLGNMADAPRFNKERRTQLTERDVSTLLDELFRRAQSLAATAGIELRYTGLNETVYTLIDDEKLERAVYNMISNALKAAPKDSCVKASLTRRGKKLYLSVIDDGPGIRDDALGTVYSHFLRTPGIIASEDGLGLGMALIRSVAILHGGTVLIDRPQGTGTRITMTLAVRRGGDLLRSAVFKVDYAGERDHGLLELVDVLSDDLY